MIKLIHMLMPLFLCGAWAQGQEAESIHELTGVWQADFNADSSRIITKLRGGKLGLWDASTGKKIANELSKAEAVDDYVLDKQAKLALVQLKADTFRAYEVRSGKAASPALVASGTNLEGAFTAEGSQVLIRSIEGDVKVFDITSGKQVAAPSLPPEEEGYELNSRPGFCPQRHLAFLMDIKGRLHRYDTRSWKEIMPHIDHKLSDSSYAIGFTISEDGHHVATFDAPGENGPNGSLQIWDLETSKAVGAPLVGTNGVSATFMGDSRCLIRYARGSVSMVSLPSFSAEFEFRRHDDVEASFAHLLTTDRRKYILSWGFDRFMELSHYDNGTHAGNAVLPCQIDSVLSPNSPDHVWITLNNTVHLKKQHYDCYIVKYSIPGLAPDAVLRVQDYIHHAVLSPDFKRLMVVQGTSDRERISLFDAQSLEEVIFTSSR